MGGDDVLRMFLSGPRRGKFIWALWVDRPVASEAAARKIDISFYIYILYIHVQTVFVGAYQLYTALAIQHPQRITLAHIRVAMHPYRESAHHHHCTVIFVRLWVGFLSH
jgi:hypothetical protein